MDSNNLQFQSTLSARYSVELYFDALSVHVGCVHLNIPAPDDEEWKVIWRRLKAMYWCMVAPELVVTWAIRQYFGARAIFNKYKVLYPRAHWTMTHAHFLQMGGFYLDSKEYTGVIDPIQFEKLFGRKSTTKFPVIKEKEIQDRSKADALSKIVLLTQTLWFVIQCIGRHVQGL
ncbi:hypothetical protein BDQ17DRAFT_1495787, partial [Cyathus striatus]